MRRPPELLYGSLFSGYEGLTIGCQAVLPGRTAWFSEIEPGPSKILAHHWPDVPNLGDITAVDWSQVEPVDVITGGSPCQDVSHAGKRAGMRAGTRSGLWASMCDAIDIIRPSLVIWENVRGALSAEADSGMEPCPGCVGGGDDGAVLRALGRVLGDLADIGYDAAWCGLRAADVGAPHGRFRVFVVAWIADAAGEGLEGGRPSGSPAARSRASSNRDAAADAGRQRHGGREDGGGLGRVDREDESRPRERERERAVTVDRGVAASADADDLGPHREADHTRGGQPDLAGGGWPEESAGRRTTWGQYAPAIGRWERVLGRVAPAPTTPDGRDGAHRLSAAAVEFLMGLPEGHVTGVGLTRNEQLKALGNGVVPQQAAAALRMLLPHIAERAA